MVKRVFSKKQIAHQKKFKETHAKCRKTTDSKKDFSDCMSKGLKKKSKKGDKKK